MVSSSFVAPVRVTHAYEELAEAIRCRILDGTLSAGERIPSEQELARQAQVSRPTVREALRTLEEAGFIKRASPRIFVVGGRSEHDAYRVLHQAYERQNVTFAQVHEALLVLEPELVRLATLRATDADLEVLKGNLDAQRAALDDVELWRDHSREFHLLLGELAGNPVLGLSRRSLSELLQPAVGSVYDSRETVSQVHRTYLRILDDMMARDPEGAAHSARRSILGFRRLWEERGRDLDLLVAKLPAPGPVPAASQHSLASGAFVQPVAR